ncbi:MAG TPA: YbaK/EbsC family protein [Bacteroidota bacterium]
MAKMSDLLKYLNLTGVQYQVLSHVPAFSAHSVALASHIPESELAKTLLVRADEQYWMAVLRGDYQLNQRLLKHALEAKHVGLATEEELAVFFPDCEVGAMPPFGKLYALPVVVDKALTEDVDIVFNACTHTQAVKMKFADYERLVRPITAEIADRIHRAVDTIP